MNDKANKWMPRLVLIQSALLILSAALNVWLARECIWLAEKVIEANRQHEQTLNDWDASIQAIRDDMQARKTKP
jgi:hypothetical protein